MKPLRITLCILTALFVVAVVAIVGGSFYMLDYALSPHAERQDTASRWVRLYADYPETQPWIDSLRRAQAFRDTFVSMPTGERHHAYLVGSKTGGKTAMVIHGWRDQAIGMLQIARIYQLMGWFVVVPDLHAHGLSQGEHIGMGWQERHDVLHWMSLFQTDTMMVHGISMGAATTMNVAGEKMPQGIRSIKFVEDCGYTSVWDEFVYELNEDFGLPPFPLLYTSSLLCRLRYGWDFCQASPLRQVSQSPYPMLFIHGDNDHFVPSWMVNPLYEAKPSKKLLWVTKGTAHARSYKDYTEEYISRIQHFANNFE